jgi:hypothetical protein
LRQIIARADRASAGYLPRAAVEATAEAAVEIGQIVEATCEAMSVMRRPAGCASRFAALRSRSSNSRMVKLAPAS